MKCISFLSLFLVFVFGLSFVLSTQRVRTIKTLKFRKWYGKRLFDKAKAYFDRARHKVEQANEMVLLAKSLVEIDNKDKELKEEKITNENTFEQFIISKLGQIKDLTHTGQFLLGFMVGDFLPRIEKGLEKSKASEFINCASKRTVAEDENMKYLNSLIKVDVNLEKEVIEGQKIFDHKISKVKSVGQIKKVFGKKLNKVNAFTGTVRDTAVGITKNAQKGLEGYYRCIKEMNKKKEMKKDLWEKVLKTKFDFSKNYECSAEPSEILFKLIQRNRAINFFKTLWNGLIKFSLIEKKFDNVDWYKAGKAVGGIGSILIKPICISNVKKITMKKWNKKYFKK